VLHSLAREQAGMLSSAGSTANCIDDQSRFEPDFEAIAAMMARTFRTDSLGRPGIISGKTPNLDRLAGFQKAADEANELPSELKLPIHAATSDHSKAICIWEGSSVEAVRNRCDPFARRRFV